MVWSVTGAVDPKELGRVLSHEHVVQDIPGFTLPGTEQMIPEVKEFVSLGGRTLVSMTNESLGRDALALRDIAIKSGATILAATGRFTREYSALTSDVRGLAKLFVRELTEGIGETGIRAAVIGEVGTSDEGEMPGEFEYELFDAVARTHAETGAPICTHTYGGRYGRWQVQYLTAHGVPANRIAVGHLDLSNGKNGRIDLDLILELADFGAYVAFDSVGNEEFSPWLGRYFPSDQERAAAIAYLVNRGYSDHILLAHDIGRPAQLRVCGGYGYGHIFRTFFPMLEKHGVGPAVSETFVTTNPLRWLVG